MFRSRLLIAALPLTLVGLLLLGAGFIQGDYVTSPTGSLRSDAVAVVTREIDVERRVPADPDPDLGELVRVRIRAYDRSAGRELFIGIGPRAEVTRYLEGVTHDEMASYSEDPFAVQFARHTGGRHPEPPIGQTFWVATAVGSPSAELQWDKTKGEWMAVVMHTDGQPGADLDADVGLRFAFLVPAGAVALAAGVALAGLAVVGLRSGRLPTHQRDDRPD